MHPIQTYRLTLWLPLAVTLLFICLLVFYSVNEYQHRLFDIKEASKTQLQETALQLGHSVEYAIANNDSQQARSSVARFTLRADAQLALLLDNNNLIESSTYFIWQNQPAERVLDEELIQYIELSRSSQKIFEYGHDQDGLLTLILPLLEANQGRVLVLQNSIKNKLKKAKTDTLDAIIPLLLMIILANFLLIALIRKMVLVPLDALQKLTEQIQDQHFGLINPLKGNTKQAQIGQTLVDAASQLQSHISILTENEQRLRITLESIGDAVIVTDAKGNITRMNSVASELTAWQEEDALGQPLPEVFDIYQAETGEKMTNPVDLVIQKGEVVELANHTVLRARNGARYHISDSAAPIRVDHVRQSEILGVILVFTNVTNQYQLRQELRQSVDFLKNLLTISPSVTYILEFKLAASPEFILSYISESVINYSGYPAEYWLDQPQAWQQSIHPDDLNKVKRTLLAVLQTDKPVTNQFRFRHRDGHYVTVEDHLSAVKDEYTQKVQIVGVVLDISEQKHTAEQNALFGEILERSLNEIYIFDAHTFKFIQVNHGAKTNLGFSTEELSEMTPVDLKKDYNLATFKALISPLLNGESQRLIFETNHCRKDGSRYDVHVDLQTAHYGESLVFIAIIEDISERNQSQKHLNQERALLRSIIDSSPDLIFCKDAQGRYIRCNQAVMRFLAANESDIIGKTDFDFYPEQEARHYRHSDQLTLQHGSSQFYEETKNGADGKSVIFETLKTPLKNETNETIGVLSISRDISRQYEAEKELRLASLVFENSNEGIIITNQRNLIVTVNPAFTVMTGYSLEDVLGKNPSILSSGNHDKYFYEQMWNQLEQQGYWSGEVQNRRKNGEIYPQWLSIRCVENAQQQLQNYVAIMSDISKYREAERQINFLAHHDVLTSLPNRALLKDRFHQALISAERHNQKLALLYLDLDRFKFINDSLGHAIGDKLLIKVAERLTNEVREEDTVCRTGGDEFIILLPETDADGAGHVAQKLVENITNHFEIEGNQLFVTVSIGISIYPDNGKDAESLNKHADTAMYRAKQAGRNQYQFFTAEMHSQIVHKLELEHALRFALARNELSLVYQPLVDIQLNKITGVEALLRWNHPEFGMISPLEFIPIAEETGMINPIGQWILHTAIAQCKQWVNQGHEDLLIAINLSAVQFNNPLLVNIINAILHEHQLAANNLELEITESVAMVNIDLTIKQLKSLADAGIRLSLDDFGTGYSSLNYLKKFPINKLKIDQSFVFDMLVDDDDEAIVDAVITLARSLGLKTLAEGVETPEHLQSLKNKGCDFMQGYLFSRPVPAEQFINLLNHPPLSNLGVD
jgi:diguanylate cyclase (GGDEF)-like protein/PAS domain S-box-containing protein